MIRERIEVPAREGRAVRLRAGDRARIVDLEGAQVVDVFAFRADDVAEYASAEHTRVTISRLFPRVGEHFYTNRRRPILLFERDDSPGVHDMLCASCDPTRYASLGVRGWHASCQENLELAMRSMGVDHVEVPQPINLFMNTPPGPDGTIAWLASPTTAGDSVTLRAEMDCFLVASACPQDLNDINGTGPTPIAIEVL